MGLPLKDRSFVSHGGIFNRMLTYPEKTTVLSPCSHCNPPKKQCILVIAAFQKWVSSLPLQRKFSTIRGMTEGKSAKAFPSFRCAIFPLTLWHYFQDFFGKFIRSRWSQVHAPLKFCPWLFSRVSGWHLASFNRKIAQKQCTLRRVCTDGKWTSRIQLRGCWLQFANVVMRGL